LCAKSAPSQVAIFALSFSWNSDGERIAFLLEHYADVLADLYDDRSGGESVRLMCSAWNHPSYQELERLCSPCSRPRTRKAAPPRCA
jgi:hypothetical protein